MHRCCTNILLAVELDAGPDASIVDCIDLIVENATPSNAYIHVSRLEA